jgi:hypothetical protein
VETSIVLSFAGAWILQPILSFAGAWILQPILSFCWFVSGAGSFTKLGAKNASRNFAPFEELCTARGVTASLPPRRRRRHAPLLRVLSRLSLPSWILFAASRSPAVDTRQQSTNLALCLHPVRHHPPSSAPSTDRSSWKMGFSLCPTPPAAPPKDDYIPDTESKGENQSSLRQAPARVFRNGKVKVHKMY